MKEKVKGEEGKSCGEGNGGRADIEEAEEKKGVRKGGNVDGEKKEIQRKEKNE